MTEQSPSASIKKLPSGQQAIVDQSPTNGPNVQYNSHFDLGCELGEAEHTSKAKHFEQIGC